MPTFQEEIQELLQYIDEKISRTDGKITPEEHHYIENKLATFIGWTYDKFSCVVVENAIDAETQAKIDACDEVKGKFIAGNGKYLISFGKTEDGKSVANISAWKVNTVDILDKRDNDFMPSYYAANYPQQAVVELKTASKIGLSIPGDPLVAVTTYSIWYYVGGNVQNCQEVNTGDGLHTRKSLNSDVWDAWVTTGSGGASTDTFEDVVQRGNEASKDVIIKGKVKLKTPDNIVRGSISSDSTGKIQVLDNVDKEIGYFKGGEAFVTNPTTQVNTRLARIDELTKPYSVTPYNTGRKWLDGKDIWECSVVTAAPLPDADVKDIPINGVSRTDFQNIISITGISRAIGQIGGEFDFTIPLPYSGNTMRNIGAVSIYTGWNTVSGGSLNMGSVCIETSSDMTAFKYTAVTIQFTRP